MTQGSLTLIVGGVRSGKSRFGERLALALDLPDVLYIATAEARDEEMRERISKHRASRPPHWQTLECPIQIAESLAERRTYPSVILLDCLTLLVTNHLCCDPTRELSPTNVDSIHQNLRKEILSLIQFARSHAIHLIIVSGEVGLGIVPDYPLGRAFRDLLGWANQTISEHGDAVFMMIAGLAIPLHASSMTAPSVAEILRQKSQRNEVPQ
jgi:adenosylcobinamide kinase/adenosylcobinamide-phosphate guanylyltransferase